MQNYAVYTAIQLCLALIRGVQAAVTTLSTDLPSAYFIVAGHTTSSMLTMPNWHVRDELGQRNIHVPHLTASRRATVLKQAFNYNLAGSM